MRILAEALESLPEDQRWAIAEIFATAESAEAAERALAARPELQHALEQALTAAQPEQGGPRQVLAEAGQRLSQYLHRGFKKPAIYFKHPAK